MYKDPNNFFKKVNHCYSGSLMTAPSKHLIKVTSMDTGFIKKTQGNTSKLLLQTFFLIPCQSGCHFHCSESVFKNWM